MKQIIKKKKKKLASFISELREINYVLKTAQENLPSSKIVSRLFSKTERVGMSDFLTKNFVRMFDVDVT